jgi:hypothetical protein
VSATDALRTLIQRYARAADERDIDALAALFHPDATIEGARGKQTLDEWLDVMRGPRAVLTSMHMLGDPLIELTDDNRATLDTYGVVYQLGDTKAGQGDITLGVRYLDEVDAPDGTWRIRARVAHILWMR